MKWEVRGAKGEGSGIAAVLETFGYRRKNGDELIAFIGNTSQAVLRHNPRRGQQLEPIQRLARFFARNGDFGQVVCFRLSALSSPFSALLAPVPIQPLRKAAFFFKGSGLGG